MEQNFGNFTVGMVFLKNAKKNLFFKFNVLRFQAAITRSKYRSLEIH